MDAVTVGWGGGGGWLWPKENSTKNCLGVTALQTLSRGEQKTEATMKKPEVGGWRCSVFTVGDLTRYGSPGAPSGLTVFFCFLSHSAATVSTKCIPCE